MRTLPTKRIATVALLLCAILLITAFPNIWGGQFPDADDALRMVQVKDLLDGQSWFDLRQYRIDSPSGTPMHWSRLVDLPLISIIILLTPMLGQSTAELAAAVVVPLATLVIVLFAVGRIASRFFDDEVVGFSCLAVGFLPLLLAQVQPLRIDHHSWQIVAVSLSLVALLAQTPRAGAWFAGLALAAGLSISIELLPFTAGYAAVLFLRWLNHYEERWWLAHFMVALTTGLGTVFAATHGYSDLAIWCDAVSLPHIAFFAAAAAGTWALVQGPQIKRSLLVIAFVVIGLIAIAFFASVAPQCLATPFSTLDPLVHEYWYVNVTEGLPFWKQNLQYAIPSIFQALIAIAVAAYFWRQSDGATRNWWFEYTVLFAVALAGGLLVWRSMAFVAIFSAVPLGWLASRLFSKLRSSTKGWQKISLVAVTSVVLVPVLPAKLADAAAAAGKGGDEQGVTGQVSASRCELNRNAVSLNRLQPGKIFAPIDIGPALLIWTHHGVVATGHHRANVAMGDVIRAFTSPEAEARQIVEHHGAAFIVVCSDLGEPQLYKRRASGGLMAALLSGTAPEWLEPVPGFTSGAFQAWKVVGTSDPSRTGERRVLTDY